MKMGWRFKKRPGLDYFLQTAAQSGYEIVIFTMEPANVSYFSLLALEDRLLVGVVC